MLKGIWVSGVDGCPWGWVIARSYWENDVAIQWDFQLAKVFRDVLVWTKEHRAVAVDIPIGLLNQPKPRGRVCDREARKILKKRSCCVFSPPARSQLDPIPDRPGNGLSLQSLNILDKIKEVDQIMSPALQNRIFEAHPELAFCQLSKAPLNFNKKTAPGIEERDRLLTPIFPNLKKGFSQTGFKKTTVGSDDLRDALVLSWVAYKFSRREAEAVPQPIPLDSRGLEMAIWY